MTISKECINNEVCIKGKNNCDCIITTGLGDNILKKIVELIEKPSKEQMTEQKIAETVDQLLRSEWENIGEIITAWCCGAPPIITA